MQSFPCLKGIVLGVAPYISLCKVSKGAKIRNRYNQVPQLTIHVACNIDRLNYNNKILFLVYTALIMARLITTHDLF